MAASCPPLAAPAAVPSASPLRTATTLLMVFALAAVPLAWSQVEFTTLLIDDDSRGNASLQAFDLDGDGDLDVLGAVIEDNDVSWWRNDGGDPIAWTKFTIDPGFSGARSVYAARIDADEHLDVLATAYASGQVAWWANDGGSPPTWTRQLITSAEINPHEVYADDVDGDGDQDVLCASSGRNRIVWWRNEGGSPVTWSEQTIGASFSMAKSVCTADLDGDSRIDVIGAAIQTNRVAWWRNGGGDPVQWTQYTIDAAFGGAHRVQAIDLDGDGDPDVVGAAYMAHQVAWWRNDGGSPIAWTKQVVGSGVTNACIAQAADIDGDLALDIAATGQGSDEISWWHNGGGSPIVWTKHPVAVLDRVWPLCVCDLDDDGDRDIVAGSSHEGGTREVRWYRNDRPTSGLGGPERGDAGTAPAGALRVSSHLPGGDSGAVIRFELPAGAMARLALLDPAGGVVAVLVDDWIGAGRHEVRLAPGEFPRGVYFAHLSAAGHQAASKLLLPH